MSPRSSLRLFCLPYEGGGASTYRGWASSLPASMEVWPVQPPGREGRLREAPFTSLLDLSRAVASAMTPYLDKPYAIFGHGWGAWLAFEVARGLRRAGLPAPVALFASGSAAPDQAERRPPIHHLPDHEFIAELERTQRAPEEVLAHAELMKLLLPLLRADVQACDTYAFTDEPAFAMPVSVFGGLAESEASRESLEGWRRATTGQFRLRRLPGDHFFVHSQRDLVLEAIARDLANSTTRG